MMNTDVLLHKMLISAYGVVWITCDVLINLSTGEQVM